MYVQKPEKINLNYSYFNMEDNYPFQIWNIHNSYKNNNMSDGITPDVWYRTLPS